MSSEKFLIIRFSAIGDIVQCLSIPAKIKEKYPDAEIHWLTREDMKGLMSHHPAVHKIWTFNRKQSLWRLAQLALKMRSEKYTHIYDVHNNTRSRLVSLILAPFGSRPFFLRRSVKRWKRFLLFRFRINKFEVPFSGQRDMLEPLEKWGFSKSLPPTPQFFLNPESLKKADELLSEMPDFIALAPSAAYFLKRWPKESFKELIEKMPDEKFVLLGGPEDTFIEDIAAVAPHRTLNLAGKCSLGASAAVISRSKILVSNDTGLMHMGEQLGVPVVAIMGPAPFGFPSRTPQTTILEKQLACRPCSKHGQGPCRNPNYHQCMMDIKPIDVVDVLKRRMQALPQRSQELLK